MTDKELREIKRRFTNEKSNISSIQVCFVNEKREIITRFSQSLASLEADETNRLLQTLKKALSGALGTNLHDMEFKTSQVVDSPEHKLLMTLKKSELKDEAAVNEFFEKVAANVSIDSGYVALLANDKYDVFDIRSDGTKSEDSSAVYSYLICAVCPVKLTKPALTFRALENEFGHLAAASVVGSPQLGFLFPAFDNRTENIYNALYYTRDITNNNTDFANAIFNTELAMPAAMQKEAFGQCLRETIAEECDFEMVKSVHAQISDMIEEHKISKEEEPLTISKDKLERILEYSGVEKEKIEDFGKKYDYEFGEGSEVPPQNIVNTKQFQLETPDVSIKVNPERRDLISTQIIGGTKYILIRAAEGVEVNGVNINIK